MAARRPPRFINVALSGMAFILAGLSHLFIDALVLICPRFHGNGSFAGARAADAPCLRFLFWDLVKFSVFISHL